MWYFLWKRSFFLDSRTFHIVIVVFLNCNIYLEILWNKMLYCCEIFFSNLGAKMYALRAARLVSLFSYHRGFLVYGISYINVTE